MEGKNLDLVAFKKPILITTAEGQTPMQVSEIVASIEKSTTGAENALKKITAITTDEQDSEALKLVGKVKKTYDKVKGLREQITKPLDQFKSELMEYEKIIRADKNDSNEYTRVIELRNKYATEKINAEKERLQKIEKERIYNEKKESYKAQLISRTESGILTAIEVMNERITTAWGSTSLEAIPALQKKLSIVGSLDNIQYENFLSYVDNAIKKEDYDKIQKEVRAERTYEICNAEFQEKAKLELEGWIDQIPQLEKDLKAGAEAAKATAERIKKEKEEKAKKDAEELKAKQEAAEQAAKVSASFTAQIQTQAETPDLTGVKTTKKAYIDAGTAEFAKVMSELFFNCFVNPKFKGIIKMTSGIAQTETLENGEVIPVYEDWVQKLLDFYAENSETEIKGLKIYEIVKISNRQRKAK